MNLLSVIPLWARLAALAVLAAALIGYGYAKGATSVQDKWDLAIAKETSAAVRVVVKQGQITERIVTQYIDRVKEIRVAGETIIKEVPIYVPADTPDLPGGFRLLHDASATGTVPDPAAAADAAPVSAQDAATTIAQNNTTSLANNEQLIKLQQWILEQQKLADLCMAPVEM
jgi:hypothetical protein